MKLVMEDFELQGAISKGSFGTVYKAVRRSDGRIFALKQVSLLGMKRADREEAIDEARMLAQLSHPHVVRHYGTFIDSESRLNILMEYAANGNLHKLARATKGGLPEEVVWRVLLQALMGLAHMHSHKIIHRDIKTLNLFLDARGNVKIGDLGIARALGDGSDFARTIVGTPYYLSPELCEDKPYNTKSDVWALGVVLYECCTGGRFPFEAQNEGALIRKIIRGTYAPLSGPYLPALLQLVHQMLTFEVSRRPDTAQLLRSPAVQAKAKELGMDLAKPAQAAEDEPVYERVTSTQQQQQPPSIIAVQQAAAAANLPKQQQPQPQQPLQQGGRQQKPGPSSRPTAGPSAAAAGRHPFELDGWQDSLVPPQQQEQQQRPQQQQPAVPQQQLPVRGSLAAHEAQLRALMQAMEVGPAKQDATGGAAGRLHPDQMPPAGARPHSSRDPTRAPWAVATPKYPGAGDTVNQQQAMGVWTAKLEAPRHGRKRCPDLMVTGPALRGAAGYARGGGRGAVPVADDATSYCTTSYAQTRY